MCVCVRTCVCVCVCARWRDIQDSFTSIYVLFYARPYAMYACTIKVKHINSQTNFVQHNSQERSILEAECCRIIAQA